LAEHSASSRAILGWDWDWPRVRQRGDEARALAREEAFAELAGRDERPLLVVRECEACRGTDDAFLSRELDNEKTILLARWFHAVKLPPEVLEDDHPFHALFEGARPPHLFVCNRDGSGLQPLDGTESQARLWAAMVSVLRANYHKDPQRAVSELRRLLDQLDRCDTLVEQAEERLLDERIAHGPKAPSVKELEKEHARRLADREKVVGLCVEADDMGLKSGG
jgi:hypothetical protein